MGGRRRCGKAATVGVRPPSRRRARRSLPDRGPGPAARRERPRASSSAARSVCALVRVPDQVEKVAVLAGRGIRPLARLAGAGEANEERAAAGAVEVAADPVTAEPAAVGQIAPADVLGARGERRGDGGGGRRAVLHMGPPSSHTGCPIPASLPSGRRPGSHPGQATGRWRGARTGRLRCDSKKGDRRRSAGPRGGRRKKTAP